MSATNSNRFLDTSELLPNGTLRMLYRPVQPMVEHFFGFHHLQQLYDDANEAAVDAGSFCRYTLERLHTDWALSPEDWRKLQTIEGPLVIVANHPFGGIDSLILMCLMEELRSGGWKILSNHIMRGVAPVKPHLIQVDALGLTARGKQVNREGLRRSLEFLRDGGCLGFFPARRVSHLDPSHGAVVDQPWSVHSLKIAARTGASLACLHIPGHNSDRFLKIPLKYPRLRGLQLCREMTEAPPRQVELRLAQCFSPTEVRRWEKMGQGTERLRAHCFLEADKREWAHPNHAGNINRVSMPPITSPEGKNSVPSNMAPSQKLMKKGPLEVFFVRGGEAPGLLNLLGRAREITFRHAGQGVGTDVDIAPLDHHYHHLIVWDHEQDGIAGAYRVGMVQDILQEQGTTGLYLDQVFVINSAFYSRFPHTMELSRSFVLPDYQKDNRILPLLWSGLAQVALKYGIQTLVGSVTISNLYHPASRALLVEFLRQEYADSPEVRHWVQPRSAFQAQSRYHTLVAEAYAGESINALNPVIQHLENGVRGIPPLMRYYCQLGARYIDFHVEAAFQHALYCLLRVDMDSIPESYKRRFRVGIQKTSTAVS